MQHRLLTATLALLGVMSLALSAPRGVQTTIDTRLNDRALSGAAIGVMVQSLTTGEVWYERNATTALIPASTAKLGTAMLALEYLKPEYQFTTRLLTNGTRNGEKLEGDLYLCGAGDPSLVSADLVAMIKSLAVGDEGAGIPPLKQITGKLILDGSFFPGNGALLGQGWAKGDLLWYYAAPSSALSLNRNEVKITVRGGAHGKPGQVTLDPPTTLFTIKNDTVSSNKVTLGAINVTRTGTVVRITGNVAPGAELSERISAPDPGRYLAEQLRQALQQGGVTVGAVEFSAAPQGLRVLVEHHSAPLGALMQTMLKESDNHYAEQLHWTLLALYSLAKPLDERYMALLQDFFNHSGMLLWGMQLVDGSGLSRMNRLSPAALTRLLAYMASSPTYDVFYAALPIGGQDGTLRRRLNDTPASGNVHAKTGTMRGVSSLSGYVTTAGGERLAFAIMLNGYGNSSAAARKLQDDIVAYLAGVND